MVADKPLTFKADNGYGQPTHLLTKKGNWIETPRGYKFRDDGIKSHVWWRGEDGYDWYDTPTVDDLNAFAGDSVCETPDGEQVEPDHPSSWLRILGFI